MEYFPFRLNECWLTRVSSLSSPEEYFISTSVGSSISECNVVPRHPLENKLVYRLAKREYHNKAKTASALINTC